MKRIKQIEESREMISKALVSLMRDEEFSKISISQITAEAGVSRNTFYRNFRCKEDILFYSFKKFYMAASKKLEVNRPDRIEDFLIWRFRLFKENTLIEAFRKKSKGVSPVFMQFLSEYPIPLGGGHTARDAYIRDYHSAGIYYVTSRWLENGAKESPEEMAALVMKLIEGGGDLMFHPV